jgi:uracil-DNA glycosylase family 4
LVAFRERNRRELPDGFNAPVPSFGSLEARLLIVGLAPGLKGANRTGRPFTGDFAGELLFGTLLHFGLARGDYARAREDSLELVDARVTNAVRCVPPENKPLPLEERNCRTFLSAEIAAMPRLHIILALGQIAHRATLAALGVRKSAFPFAHGAQHRMPGGLILVDSYHCSRYNTQTGVLTADMFRAVIAGVQAELAS